MSSRGLPVGTWVGRARSALASASAKAISCLKVGAHLLALGMAAWKAAAGIRLREGFGGQGMPAERGQRYAAVGAVVLLHVVVLWALASGLRITAHKDDEDVQITLVRPSIVQDRFSPPPEPMLLKPEAVLVAEPDIRIDSDSPNAVSALFMSQVLPPRPDPQHQNSAPELPAHFKPLHRDFTATLKIFVEPDGSVSDAQVTHSTGDRSLDALATEFVRANWRFVAASASGRAVPDWTTVLVAFR